MPRFILFALLLLAACDAEAPQNAAEIAGNSADNILAKSEDPAAPKPARSTIGPLRIQYDSALLAPFQAKVALPPDWTNEVEGLKLIGRDRAALIGKAECLYGLSGQASSCNVQQEAGLSFASLDIAFADLAARLPPKEVKPISLARAQGLSWQIGAEGEGAEYILLPAGKGSILIVRQFRTSGNPDDGALGAVLGDLTIEG